MLIPYNTDAPLYHLPIATVGMILLNTVVFALQPPLDDLDSIEFLLKYALLHGDGLHPVQWVTSSFIHGDIFHLLGNMFCLWGFGLVVEGKIGWWRFLTIYFGIGIVQNALEQSLTCVLAMAGVEMGLGSFGASAVVYGLMGIALVWAPKNDMHCFLLIIIRPVIFQVSVMTFAAFAIVLEFILASIGGWGISSQILHLMGAGLGLAVGVGMLKLRWVDCENWDVFSVMTGRHQQPLELKSQRALPGEPKRIQLGDPDERQKALEQIRAILEDGKPALAYAAHQRMRRSDTEWKLPDADFLKIISAYHAQRLWSESVAAMVEYLKDGQAATNAVRLKLAEILLLVERRPASAIAQLKRIEGSSLSEKHDVARGQLMAQAEKMLATGQGEFGLQDP